MPVYNGVPPVEALYQRTVLPFAPGDAVRVTIPVPHRELLVPDGEASVA